MSWWEVVFCTPEKGGTRTVRISLHRSKSAAEHDATTVRRHNPNLGDTTVEVRKL